MSGFGDNSQGSPSPFGGPFAAPAANSLGSLKVQAPSSSPGSLLGAAPSPATSGFGAVPSSASTTRSISSSSSESIVPDETIVAQLEPMGFSTNACRRAAIATGNASADDAIQWLLKHIDDPGLNSPIETKSDDVFAPESPKAPASGSLLLGAQPAPVSVFGGAPAPAPAPAPSVFGAAPSQVPSVFGAAPSQAPSVFTAAPSPAPSVFTAAPSPAPSVFGAVPSPAPSVFGAVPSPAPSVFGAVPSPGTFTFSKPSPAFTFGSPATPTASAASIASVPVTPGELVTDSRRSIEKHFTVIGPTSGLAIREREDFVSKKVGVLAVGDVIDSSEECDILVTSGSTKIQFTVVQLKDGRGWVAKCSPTSIFLEEPTTVEQWY